MTYQEFLANLNTRGMFRIHPNLDRITRVLRILRTPQDSYPSIHIAGTNGKGSVASGLEAALRAAGFRTGLYTSPHLIDLRERIQVNGKPVLQGFCAMAQIVINAEKKSRTTLTYFEFLTAIAFQAFAMKKVDIAIIECGMGGLWDATNVLSRPLASIITSIGLDHKEWLGDDERQIALQKAGIIKAHGYVISGVRGSGQESIIRAAREKDATLVQIDQDFTSEALTSSWRTGKQTLRYQFRQQKPEIIPFGLMGKHQADNAALIMTTLRHLESAGWDIPSARRDQALKDIHWPGRLQILHYPQTASILLDGAHNPPAMKVLLQSIETSIFKNCQKTFIFSAFKDKDYGAMARMILPMAAEICLCTLPGERAASLEMLRSAFPRTRVPIHSFSSIEMALEHALEAIPKDGAVLITGSLSLVGAAMKALRRKKTLKPQRQETTHV